MLSDLRDVKRMFNNLQVSWPLLQSFAVTIEKQQHFTYDPWGGLSHIITVQYPKSIYQRAKLFQFMYMNSLSPRAVSHMHIICFVVNTS